MVDESEDDAVDFVHSRAHPSVGTLTPPERQGKGRAVREGGLGGARFDHSGFIEVDSPVCFEHFERLIQGLEAAVAALATPYGAELFGTLPLERLFRAMASQGRPFDIGPLYHWRDAGDSSGEIATEWGVRVVARWWPAGRCR